MKFYKLTEEIAAKLRSLKLSGSEWKVWSYLVTVCPFSDNYQKFELIDLLSECEVSKSTFYRAIAKLQEAELIDVQATELLVKNLTDVTIPKSGTTFPELGQDSQNWDNFPKSGTTFPNLGQLSQNWENEARKAAPRKASKAPQTIQTYTDLSDSSEAKPKNKSEEPKKDFLENKKLAAKQIGFRELQDFETQLGRVGVKVLVYQDGEIIQNEKLTASAIFLGETSEELRSRSIKQFLGWIETKKNVLDIYAIFHTSLKNFVESNS